MITKNQILYTRKNETITFEFVCFRDIGFHKNHFIIPKLLRYPLNRFLSLRVVDVRDGHSLKITKFLFVRTKGLLFTLSPLRKSSLTQRNPIPDAPPVTIPTFSLM